MRNITEEARRVMNTRRDFVNYAHVTLSDGTELNLTPSDFRISGNNFTDDWCEGESFQLGSAIGKTATLLLDNTDGRTEEIANGVSKVYVHGKFSEYDFYMAYFELYIHLPKSTHYDGELVDTVIPIGTFTVTTPTANSATIELVGVDNMYKFDKDFNECDLDFTSHPTLRNILDKCCNDCGVAIGYTTFSNQNLTVSEKPQNTTYRQVVSWIAQIAGCNATINITGALTLKWYDMSAFASNLDGGIFDAGEPIYETGDDADGGSFDPWDTGDIVEGGDFTTPLGYHNLKSVNGTTISTDDIHFTGVLVSHNNISEHYPSTTGWDYYVMSVTENPFVAGNESTIAQFLYGRVSGLNFRPFTTTSIQDPTIEAGDCAIVYDVKGNNYRTIITNVKFSTGSMTELSCNAEPPANQSSRYTNQASYQAAKAAIKVEREMTEFNQQVAHFNEIANAALGYYKTYQPDPVTGALLTYLHNNPTLEASQYIIKITASGMFISDDGGVSYNNGLDTTTATLLMNLVYVHGLTADWIRTGELFVGGLNNIDGIIRVTNRTTIETKTIDSSASLLSFTVGPSQISQVSASYRIYYTISNIESGKTRDIRCYIQKRDKWDGSTYTYKTIVDSYLIDTNSGEFPIKFDIDVTDANKYYMIFFTRPNTSYAGFTVTDYRDRINTTVDRNGIETSAITAKAGYIGNGSSGWTIGSTDIHNTCTSISDDLSSHDSELGPGTGQKISIQGTYVGTNGIRNQYNWYDSSTSSINRRYIRLYQGTLSANNVSLTGTIYAKWGYIGAGGTTDGWTIGTYAIYNTCMGINDDLSSHDSELGPSKTYIYGTYLGIAGIRNQYNFYYSGTIYRRFTKINQGEVTTNRLIAEGGTIGSSTTTSERWNIGSKSIWNGCAGVESTAIGTYVGTDGIRNQGADSKYIQLYQGKLTANSVEVNGGTLAGLTVELAEKGLSFNGTISTPYQGTYHNVSHYFKISAYGGITAGRQMDSSNGDVRSGGSGWIRLDWVQGYGMLKVDFGPAANAYRGIIVTNAGNNKYYDAGSSYIQIMSGSIWNNTNGKEAAWTTSDRRLKKNIKDLTIEEAKNLISIARPRSFELIREAGVRYGFIAQELREVLDDDSGIEFTSEETGYHLVNYDDFIAPLCMIVKDQQEQIDRQQEEINDLKTRLERLESIVNTMQ